MVTFDGLAHAAADAPHLPALRTHTHTLTFQELDAETRRMEHFLHAQNIQPGDRIAAQLEPSSHFISLLFATLRINALFCPLNLRLPTLSHHLSRLTPKLLFTSNTHTTFPSSPPSPLRSQLLLFTSGTTGTPKIACLPQHSLEASAASAVTTLDLRPADCWHLSLPLHHVGGLGIVFRCIHARACMSTSGSNITHVSYVPTQLYRAWPTSKRLRCVLLGGAPIPEVLRELPIVTSYGMTETSSLVLADGRPLPGKEVKLVDGEMFVRGDSMFSGYWGEAAHEGWFATRDLGRLEGGQFVITGRKDRQFISGGENIQPEEIELALLAHPDVLEVVVKPRADAEYGMRPVAYLRTTKTSDLRAFLLKKLPPYKVPLEFLPLPEAVHSKLL